METKKRNYRRFWGFLIKEVKNYDARFKDVIKDGLVLLYTNNRTSSLRNMTDDEYMNMIDGLIGESKADRNHYIHEILLCIEECGISTRKTNYPEVNDFVRRHSGTGKTLPEMNIDELKKTLKVMHVINYNQEKKNTKLRTLEICN
jgi:hypothetical protein